MEFFVAQIFGSYIGFWLKICWTILLYENEYWMHLKFNIVNRFWQIAEVKLDMMHGHDYSSLDLVHLAKNSFNISSLKDNSQGTNIENR